MIIQMNHTASNYKQGPCPKCSSSDAFTTWDNGSQHCFSCNYHVGKTQEIPEKKDYKYLPLRGLSEETMRRYYCHTEIVEGTPKRVAFQYDGWAKIRDLSEKKFQIKPQGVARPYLYGMNKFDKGSRDSITITEGEFDAMSIYQISQGKTAAVSVSSASSAKRDILEHFDYVNSFNKVILCFDQDGPGQEAKEKVKALFDPRKVLICNLTKYKDANEYLQQGEPDELYRAWAASKMEVPAGVLHTYSELSDALSDTGSNKLSDYPFKALQNSLYGLHKGEFVIFKGPEGIGKTEVFRAIEYDLLRNTDLTVGILHLEENISYTMRGLVTYDLLAPANMGDAGVTNDDVMDSYHHITGGNDNRCYIKSSMGTDDPDEILGTIRFLASGLDCDVIFLDHLSMLVTGLNDEDERKTLDYIATKIAKMVDELQFCFVTIMHVNDDGKTRSSRYPPKIAHSVINMYRDIEAEDPIERNKTYFTIQKGRAQGTKTGPAGHVVYDQGGTWTLKDPEFKNTGNHLEDELPPEILESVA